MGKMRRGAPGIPSLLPAALGIPFFVAVNTQLVILPPTLIPFFALTIGFTTGCVLRLGIRRLPLVLAWLAVWQLAIPSLLGRSTTAILTTIVVQAVSVTLLSLLGRSLRLRRVTEPRDMMRFLGLSAAAAALIPTLAALTVPLMDMAASPMQVFVQAILAGFGGMLLGGGIAVSMPSRAELRRQTPGTLIELAVVAGVVAAMLTINGLTAGRGITGAAPLYVMIIASILVAVRHGTFAASTLLTAVAIVIGLETARGLGVFPNRAASPAQAVLAAQVYVLVTALGVFLLSLYVKRTRALDAEARTRSEVLTNALEGARAQLFMKHYDPATDRFVYTEVSDSLTSALGVRREDMLGASAEDFYDADTARRFREEDEEVFGTGRRLRSVTTVDSPGPTTYITNLFPLHDERGEIVGVGGVSLDHTDEIRRERLLRLVFDRSPIATVRLGWTGSERGIIHEANAAFAELVNAPPEQLVGVPLSQLTGDTDLTTDRILDDEGRHEVRLRRRDGVELTVLASATLVEPEEGGDCFLLLILRDITDARATQARLLHRATHDPLTDLLNRQALVEQLSQPRRQGGTVPSGTALLCCDVDGFKWINDTLGHDTGDRILLAVADRIRTASGSRATIARLGADEFVVALTGSPGKQEALAVADRIRESIGDAIPLDGRSHQLSISIGVVISHGDIGADELLRQGDVALGRAKTQGRDRTELYQPELDRQVQMRMAMRETLSSALSENRIEAHLQPVVELRTGRILGAESLVRLRDLDGSLLSPAAVIPVAEESGMIAALGLRVLDISLAIRRRWADAGSPLTIAVNVSPVQLSDESLPATVASLLATHQVAAEDVTLEVTETSVMDASGPTLAVLRSLRETGLHVAIDDFGTGYSSLSSLRHLPADIIKIDRSFVSGLGGPSDDDAIVRGVLAMAHDTGRIVVAEGVETVQQARHLEALGCDRVQGFLYSRPVPPIDFDPDRRFPSLAEWSARERLG